MRGERGKQLEGSPEAGPVERDDAAAGARGQRRHDQAPGESAAAEAVDEHHRALRARSAALKHRLGFVSPWKPGPHAPTLPGGEAWTGALRRRSAALTPRVRFVSPWKGAHAHTAER